ncbi:dihydrofolate reductase [Salinivirga cyanobacteriivorans]
MKVSLIAAMSQNLVIGKNGEVPWNLPDDLKWLQERIEGHYLLMGRKTFEEPQQELKNNKTIVVTSKKNYNTQSAQVAHSIKEGIQKAETLDEKELMVVGGGKIYEAALPYADRLYLTQINAEIDGDTFFPSYNLNDWNIIYNHYHPKDSYHAYDFEFQILEKVKD